MNKKLLSVAILCMSGLASCDIRQAFYVSPYNGNHNPYHPIPLKEDSIKSAAYVGLAISNGTANDRKTDGTLTFFTSISRAHNFGNFQGFYAANISFGNYKVAPFSSSEASNFDPAVINQNAGNKFFGSTGIDGGINFVLPVGNAEWRVLGIETSVQQEFGNYASFRRKLTDKDADFIVRNKLFATAGGYTELVGAIANGSLGLKLAAGSVLGSKYHNLLLQDETTGGRLRYNYTNLTFHLTKKRFTGYTQLNFAQKSQSLFFGINYRLGK